MKVKYHSTIGSNRNFSKLCLPSDPDGRSGAWRAKRSGGSRSTRRVPVRPDRPGSRTSPRTNNPRRRYWRTGNRRFVDPTVSRVCAARDLSSGRRWSAPAAPVVRGCPECPSIPCPKPITDCNDRRARETSRRSPAPRRRRIDGPPRMGKEWGVVIRACLKANEPRWH